MFAGIGVLVDREAGAQRELLAAPIHRWLMVIGNLVVAFGITALQIGVLLAVAHLRGIPFDVSPTGVLWFTAACALFAIGMYGVAETLAARVPRTEEYISRVPAIAIVPWFLAGSLFPITALPVGLTWFARFLPLTHALALVRYGLLSDPSGLRHIWRMNDVTEMAWLSLLVVAVFAALLTAVSIRIFQRTAVR
jgi:ABC-2 type transport system permease protein